MEPQHIATQVTPEVTFEHRAHLGELGEHERAVTLLHRLFQDLDESGQFSRPPRERDQGGCG